MHAFRFVFLGSLLFACSSSSSSNDGGADATTDAIVEASTDAGSNDATKDALADAGPSKTTNTFVLWSTTEYAYGESADAGGLLTNLNFRNYALPPNDPCATQITSGCLIMNCGATDASTPTGVSAGELTLKKGATQILAAAVSTDGTYPGGSSTTIDWLAGDTLTFSAPGDAIPAFSQDLTAPPLVNWISPASSDAGVISVSLASSFTATWTPGSGTTVIVLNTGVAPTFVRIACAFDASAGTGTVPTTVMGELTPGQGHVQVGGQASVDVDAGGYILHTALINSFITAADFE